MELQDLNSLYKEALVRAEGESANEGGERIDPDSWLMARGEGMIPQPAVVPGGAGDAAAMTAEQAAIAANQALARLQTAKTEAEQLVINLRARLAEMDDLDVFVQRVNYYREKQDELETLLGQLGQTRAATEEARDEAQTALRSASLEKGNANRYLAEVTQVAESNSRALDMWRIGLGDANNVYTSLAMLNYSDAATFAQVLDRMATPSVGYFSLEFPGWLVPGFASTLMTDMRDREFEENLTYQLLATIHKTEVGYMASICWTAHDENGVYSPMTFEDRVEMGTFNTGWVVRQYVPASTVYGG